MGERGRSKGKAARGSRPAGFLLADASVGKSC